MEETHHQEEARTKTDQQLCGDCTTIQPEWTRGHALAEKILNGFTAEHFKPIAEQAGKYVGEHLWDMIRDSLLSDTQYNVEGHIRYRIEESVKALLAGDQWAIAKYVLGDRYDHKDIRATLANAIAGPLQDARVKDLEAQVAQLEADLKHEREWNRR